MENKELEPSAENKQTENISTEENKSALKTAPEEEKVSEEIKSEKDSLKTNEIPSEVINKKSEKITEEKKPAKSKNSTPKKKKSSGKKPVKNAKKKKKVNTSVFGGIISVTIVLTISIVLAVKGISIGMEYWGVGKSDKGVSFNIPQGASNDKIADILKENGIIESKDLFALALKIRKPEVLYPGDITLRPSMGYTEVIEQLAQMRESYKTVRVTIPEGANLVTVANLLEKKKVCKADDFMFEFNKNQGYDFENKINVSKDAFYRMEGYFVPETYEFYVDDSAYNVTKIIREQFEKVFTEDMYKKVDESGLTLNQVMTLASIVQLEAENVKQMPYVASVFLNRLNNKTTFPKLQSDTTKNYVTRVIKRQADSDASIDHYAKCYDTYRCEGLPAGPICNPGVDAINAVLNPAKTDYYYFCNNLKTKKTYYAKTLKQHERNLKAAGLK